MSNLGKILFTIAVLAIAGLAIFKWLPGGDGGRPDAGVDRNPDRDPARDPAAAVTPDPGAGPAGFEFVAVPDRAPTLPPPGTYQMRDDTVVIELSEYAGYAGLIVANNGLEPKEDSFFFREYGFKLHLTTSEEDSWPALQRGDLAGSSTTADVLPVYGRSFAVTVPAQICFSRGADGIIVRQDVRGVNGLKGKVLACAPFNETEFFIRYLAAEADLPVRRLAGIGESPDPAAVNLVFCEDAMVAGDAFLADLNSGGGALAGCVTWAPKTTEIVEESGGAAKQLVDNRNLLIISDILMFNKGFATEHPEIVKGVVHGLLEGNRQVRADPSAHYGALAEAFAGFGWTPEDAADELSKVHLCNLAENRAFFSGAIDAAGSFEGIYNAAALAYGSDIIASPVAADSFHDPAPLAALTADGHFADDEVAIKPIPTTDRSPVEADPLLSKDIRFLFEPNSSVLDRSKPVNTEYLETVKRMVQVSPGSVIVLRGHVDDAQIEVFRAQGEAVLQKMALRAIQLSKDRAEEVKRHLAGEFGVDADRLEVIGRGWEEPLGKDSEQNRRVEVQWFTLE